MQCLCWSSASRGNTLTQRVGGFIGVKFIINGCFGASGVASGSIPNEAMLKRAVAGVGLHCIAQPKMRVRDDLPRGVSMTGKRDAIDRACTRGQLVKLGDCYMLEMTRQTAVESLESAIVGRGGWIVSITSEKRDTGAKRLQTVYTVIAVW